MEYDKEFEFMAETLLSMKYFPDKVTPEDVVKLDATIAYMESEQSKKYLTVRERKLLDLNKQYREDVKCKQKT